MADGRFGLGRGSAPRRSQDAGASPGFRRPDEVPILLSPSDSVMSDIRKLTSLLPACQISSQSQSLSPSQRQSQDLTGSTPSQSQSQDQSQSQSDDVNMEDGQRISQDILSQAIQDSGVADGMDVTNNAADGPDNGNGSKDDVTAESRNSERESLGRSSSGVSSNADDDQVLAGDFNMDYVSPLGPVPCDETSFRPRLSGGIGEGDAAAGLSQSAGSRPKPASQTSQWRQRVAKKSGSGFKHMDTNTAISLSAEVEMMRDQVQAREMIRVEPNEKLMSPDDFLAVAYREDDQAMTEEMTISVPELILHPREEFNRALTAVGSMKFIIVLRPKDSTVKWSPVSNDVFSDVINLTQAKIIEEKRDCYEMFHYANIQGGVGLLGLKIFSPPKLSLWRKPVTEVSLGNGGMEFNTFPKECLVSTKTQVSLLLRSNLRNFKLQYLNHGLRLANRKLCGKLTPTFSKPYGSSAQTRHGTSKDGWRLVLAEIDEPFFRSLSNYPPGHIFSLGAGSVQIRVTTERSSECPVATPASTTAARRDIPELIRSISHPVPLDRPAKGPGSRGGKVRGARGKRVAARSTAKSRLPPNNNNKNNTKRGSRVEEHTETFSEILIADY